MVIFSQYDGFFDLYKLIRDTVFLDLRLASNFTLILRCSRCSWLNLRAHQLSMLLKFFFISNSKFYSASFRALICRLQFECILDLTAQCFRLQVISLLPLDSYSSCLHHSFAVSIIITTHFFFPRLLSQLFSIRTIVYPLFSFGSIIRIG